jgi:hypothetical protein
MIINAIIKFSNQFMKLNCQKHEKYGYYNLSSLPFDSTTVITKMVLLGKFHFKLPSMIKTRYEVCVAQSFVFCLVFCEPFSVFVHFLNVSVLSVFLPMASDYLLVSC